jgi:hypothetical protein
LQDLADEKREFMIESAAEANDELMEKYLPLTHQNIHGRMSVYLQMGQLQS